MMGDEELNNSAVLSVDKNEEVSHAKSKTAIETTIDMLSNERINILFQKKWRDIASINKIKSKKQKEITDFCVKNNI